MSIKVGLLNSSDVTDIKSFSGIFYFMYRELEKNGYEVIPLGPATSPFEIIGKALNRVSKKITNKKVEYRHSKTVSKSYARIFNKWISRIRPDIIFAPNATAELAYLNSRIPYIYASGSTFRLMVDYYDSFTNIWPSLIRSADAVERKALENAERCVFPTDWAARSAQYDYGINPDKIDVIPYGPNLKRVPSREGTLKNKSMKPINILFVGVDWRRKGGNKTYNLFLELKRRGFQVNLTVCGTAPPDNVRDDQDIKVYEFLDKNDPNQLDELLNLYREAHFLVMPTEAECFGIVAVEAFASGVPVITHNTGGISDIVTDGDNGFLFEKESGVHEMAEKIIEITDRPEQYKYLSANARNSYEEYFNWNHWGRQVDQLIKSCVR